MTDAQLVPLILGGVFSLLGLIFLAFGKLRARMVRSWTRTTGVVVNRDGSTNGWPVIYPTFRWRDQHGQDHQRRSGLRGSLGPAPGTLVPVLYDPDEPSRAVIDTTVQSGRIFVGIGAGLLTVGLTALTLASFISLAA